ncbi:MAG TPA: hypothetical protein DCZ48_01265 [Methylococcaceae bacterium]|nr:hypothetical protein [Methylococcaceae bacterium]
MNSFATKGLTSFRYALEANYYVSLAVSVAAATLSFTNDQAFFELNTELYGPLSNNIKIMMIYIVLAELSMFAYCMMKQSYKELTAAGLFLILLSGALEFYGRVNQIPIDHTYRLFFLYAGLSHIAYGLLSFLPVKQEHDGQHVEESR